MILVVIEGISLEVKNCPMGDTELLLALHSFCITNISVNTKLKDAKN